MQVHVESPGRQTSDIRDGILNSGEFSYEDVAILPRSMWEFFQKLFNTADFARYGDGDSGWTDQLVNIHVVSDLMAGTAFLAVFGFIAWHIRLNRDRVPSRIWLPVILLAIAGLMHFMDLWQMWWPAHRFGVLLKLIAATVAWATLFSFVPFISRILSGGTWGDLQLQIHRRRQVEQRLLETEAAHRSMVENLPLHLFRKDLQGHFVEVNKRLADIIGKPAEELIGKTDYDLFPEFEARKYRRDDERVVSEGIVLDDVEEQTLPDGRITYVQVLKAPVRDAAGTIVGVQGILGRHRAETGRGCAPPGR